MRSRSTTYRLRAEVFQDLAKLAIAMAPNGGHVRMTAFTIVAVGIGSLPNFEMLLDSPLTLDELLAVIGTIEDGHVMFQTVAPLGRYTGERDFDRLPPTKAKRARRPPLPAAGAGNQRSPRRRVLH